MINLYFRISSIFILLLIALFGGLIPIKWSRLRESSIALSYLNSFSGGIFLSMGILHLLPEANENFKSAMNSDYPIAYALAIAGFSFVLFIEKIAVDAHQLLHTHQHEIILSPDGLNNVGLERSISNVSIYSHKSIESEGFQREQLDERPRLRAISVLIEEVSNPINISHNPHNPNDHPNSSNKNNIQRSGDNYIHSPLLEDTTDQNFINNNTNKGNSTTTIDNIDTHHSIQHTYQNNEKTLKIQTNNNINTHNHTENHIIHQHHHDHGHSTNVSTPSTATAYVLMFALSIHAILEGIALGIQSDLNQFLTLFVGILLHKGVEAAALATSFIKQIQSSSHISYRRASIFLCLFAFASPAGIAIGILISSEASQVFQSSVLSIAAGSFIYIATQEIIAEEFATTDRKNRTTKFILFLIGIGIIAGLAAYSQ